MRTLSLAALALVFVGCSTDPDGDGLSNTEEADLGTDPKDEDSDNDGLNDLEETEVGTDPLNVDSDDDGLNDFQETQDGLNPLSADSDVDGFPDGDEMDEGSDPTAHFNWPFGGNDWPDYSADAPETDAYGWEEGDTIENFEVIDQFDNEIDLYRFSGYVILMDLSAGWCGPCRQVAATAQDEWEARREDGFLIFHMMIDDNTGNNRVTDDAFLAEWADGYGLEFPVVKDQEQTAYVGFSGSSLYEGGIPFMVLIDQNMQIDSAYTGSGAENQAFERAEELMSGD